MTILNTCCFCVGLELGVAILGWLGALVSVLDIISIIFNLIKGVVSFNLYICISLAVPLLHLIVAACLIKATLTKNKRLLVPWLVVSIINLLLITIMFIVMGIHVEAILPYIGGAVLFDAVGIYFWLCVYSYYQELDPLIA